MMKLKRHIQKITVALASLLLVQVVSAAFTSTGNTNSGSNNSRKYSLKTLSKYSVKPLSVDYVRNTFKLKATEIKTVKFNHNTTTAGIQLNQGNTTFIVPFQVKIKVPKFKTPAPAHH